MQPQTTTCNHIHHELVALTVTAANVVVTSLWDSSVPTATSHPSPVSAVHISTAVASFLMPSCLLLLVLHPSLPVFHAPWPPLAGALILTADAAMQMPADIRTKRITVSFVKQ